MTQETQEIQATVAAVLDKAPAESQDLPTPAGGPPAPSAPKTAAKKRKAKKRVKRIIALVVTLALLAGIGWAVWYFLLRKTVEQGQLLEDEVRIGTIQSKVEGSGNARAGENAVITLSASGTVQDVYVAANDVINEGDPLYSIYSPAAQKAVQDAEEAVEQAQEAIPAAEDAVVKAQEAVQEARDGVAEAQDRVKEAEDEVVKAQDQVKEAEDGVTEAQDRVKEAEDGVVEAQNRVKDAEDGVVEAQDRVKDAEDAVTEARNGVKEAEDAVKDAEEGVQDAQAELAKRQKELAGLQADAGGVSIAAPFAGRLTSVEAIAPGDELSAGGAVATLVNDSVMKLTLYFSYAYENSICAGQAVDVSVPSMTLSCPGTVSAVNKIRKVTPEGAILFEVEIAVPNPGALTEGLEATGSMKAADGSRILPYDGAKLAYSEVRKITAKVTGKVVSVDMRADAAVAAGQVLVLQSTENVDELIEAKQKEIKQAEKGVETAKKGVETAKKGVETAKKGVESAQKDVETAKKGVETAKKGVETAKKGVVSAQKDVETAKKGVEAAQKGVETAQKGVETAQKGVKTAQKGVTTAQRGVTDAQKAVEKAIKDVEKAKRAVPEAEEALEKARKDLEELNAVAPISGTITSCTISPGQEVKGGDTVITISDTTNMVVEIKVDDQNIGFVTPGMTVELTNYGDGMWIGTVTKIDMNPSQDDMGSGVTKYPVTLTVDNYDGTLITGMWLQYSFVASQSEDCLIVPNQAVKSTVDEEGNDITVVFLKADSRPDNAVTMPEQSPDMPKKYPTEDEGYYAVPVVIGLSDTYNVEIKSGLNEFDVVFTNYLSASGNSWGMYG